MLQDLSVNQNSITVLLSLRIGAVASTLQRLVFDCRLIEIGMWVANKGPVIVCLDLLLVCTHFYSRSSISAAYAPYGSGRGSLRLAERDKQVVKQLL